MRRTFNCGLGMIVAVGAADAEHAVSVLTNAGEAAFVVGEVVVRTTRNDDDADVEFA
jgi:phosphoribosylformylglycinamidine cyclo-ligase